MKYTFFIPVALVLFIMCALNSCKSGEIRSREEHSIIQAEKPVVDSSRIIPLLDLYRAKRYEDLQIALADGPERVFKLTFHGMKIGELPVEVASFPYLATLDVAGNELAVIPEEIAGLHYLQGFYAGDNKLREFPLQIVLLPLLARLDLSDNQIGEVPPEIVRMDQLAELNLAGNLIQKLPVQLYELNRLRFLNLSRNGLSEIPGGISSMHSLEKLDLSFNQLRSLPREIASMGEHLRELEIHGNQIPREEIDWFTEAMPSTNIRF